MSYNPWPEEGVPRAPRPAVAVPPAPANYVPQSLRPSQSAGAIAASEEGRSQVRNRERAINFLFTVLLLAAVRKGKGRQSIYQAGTGFSCFVCTSDVETYGTQREKNLNFLKINKMIVIVK